MLRHHLDFYNHSNDILVDMLKSAKVDSMFNSIAKMTWHVFDYSFSSGGHNEFDQEIEDFNLMMNFNKPKTLFLDVGQEWNNLERRISGNSGIHSHDVGSVCVNRKTTKQLVDWIDHPRMKSTTWCGDQRSSSCRSGFTVFTRKSG